MTLRRRTELLNNAGRPMNARQKRRALRLSGRDRVIRWIGAAHRRRAKDENGAAPAAPPAEVIVLSWKQLFGRAFEREPGPASLPDRVTAKPTGSNLLAFRSN